MKSATGKPLPRLDERKCKSIGPCVEACPEQVIAMHGFRIWLLKHEHAILAHPERCTACGACVEACPAGAWNL